MENGDSPARPGCSPFATGCPNEDLLKTTGVQTERALLVGVEFISRPQALPRSAALARDAAKLAGTDALVDQDHPVTPIGSSAAFAEFRELVAGAGAEVVAEVLQRRPKPDPATLVGKGKVEEIAAVAASSQATLILFDHDLSPTQLRNLEKALPVRVVDRTQLILDIFARHARSREGHLQVELAQLEYTLPRLAGRGAAMSQLGGGIGTRGPGETQLETDRRKIQRRLLQLKQELEDVRRVRKQQRHRRAGVPVPTIALVGYTNAGKSTLFNRLTDAGVLASSRMFSTLDPKLRSLVLPSRRKVLLSDTVGFIRNLPHTLITSFRATLEEVEKADLLLHVQDCSNPQREQQKEEVEKVLKELGAMGKPILSVLNKVDRLPAQERSACAPGEWGAVVSAQTGEGISYLIELMDRALIADPVITGHFMVPQREGAVLAALEAGTLILKREFSGDLVDLSVEGPASLLGRYRQYRRPAKSLRVGTGRGGGSGATSHETGPV
jgi:GTP-binding protein HflX